MDRGAWWATVHGVAKNWTQLRDFSFTIYCFCEITTFNISFKYVSTPCGSDGKESACSEGDPGSIPRSGRSPGEGNGNLF